MRDKNVFLVDDLDRAAANRRKVVNQDYIEAYLEQEYRLAGVPVGSILPKSIRTDDLLTVSHRSHKVAHLLPFAYRDVQ